MQCFAQLQSLINQTLMTLCKFFFVFFFPTQNFLCWLGGTRLKKSFTGGTTEGNG